MLDQLYVYIYILDQGWVPCGVVSFLDAGRNSSSAFAYSTKYLKNPNAICLDPHQLPLSTGEKVSSDGMMIFNGLRDASPDAWGRYVMSKRFPSTSLGELHYLAGTNPDRVGALAFGPNPIDGPKIWTESGWISYEMKYLDIGQNIKGIDDLLLDEKNSMAYKQVVEFASGSGGARPKANVIWEGKLHLAKFSISTDTFNIPAVEYATMSLAKECGINIPNIHISKALGRDVFLIERFDRDINMNPTHFISGLTLTNIAENEFERFSYRELCENIVVYSSNYREDLKELFYRVAFNICVNNNDDHLRNYGFLYDQNKTWRLSPHYDVVPSLNSTGGGFALSLSLMGGKQASEENLIASSSMFRISKEEGKEIYSHIQSYVSKNWKERFKEVGVDLNTIKRFELSFSEK